MDNFDFQGKRKAQYETSAKIVFYCTVAFVAISLTILFLS
jgi:hypothetical protein